MAFVRQALNLYDAVGLEETVAYYNSNESIDGQGYVFTIDGDGSVTAHHAPEALGQGPDSRAEAKDMSTTTWGVSPSRACGWTIRISTLSRGRMSRNTLGSCGMTG